jgi:hypothetical protein
LARGEHPLLPARLGEVQTEAQFGVDPLEYRHPIAAPFRGQERAGLLTTPVGRYFRIEMPNEKSQAETALALPNGDPLVVTAVYGRGRVVLVATAGSLASVDRANGEPWTTWPAWPSFLPVVREILAFAVGGQGQELQTLVGKPIVTTLPTADSVSGLEMTRPDGRKVSLRSTTDSADQAVRYEDSDIAGIYSLRRADKDVVKFVVNVDTRESDLARVDLQHLPAEILVRTNLQQAGAVASGVLPESPWNRSLLWGAGALALLELCLAWLFGRGTA